MNLKKLLVKLKNFCHKSETPLFSGESRRTNVHLYLYTSKSIENVKPKCGKLLI